MRKAALFILLGALSCGGVQANEAETEIKQTAFRKSLQEHPGSAAAHLAFAEFLSDSGMLRAAIVHWQAAQQIEPANAATANSLGGAYLRLGRAAESADQFLRAVALESANAAYHFNLANVEFMLRGELTAAWHVETPELLRRALAQFREASRLAPNDFEYARAYAETFYGVPDPDWLAADAAWKHALALSPQSDFIRLQLARVSLKRGDKAQARLFLDKVTDPRHEALKQKLRGQADSL